MLSGRDNVKISFKQGAGLESYEETHVAAWLLAVAPDVEKLLRLHVWRARVAVPSEGGGRGWEAMVEQAAAVRIQASLVSSLSS